MNDMIIITNGADKMVYAVVRVRGNINVKPNIKDTLKMLRLNKVEAHTDTTSGTP